MVKRLVVVTILLASFRPAEAATFRFFGSGGVESQFTPANESSPLNPDNVAGLPRTTTLADASAFGELLTDDKRWKLRVKLRGEASDRAGESLELGEGFIQVRATPWLSVTAGRVIEKWGTGYAWTPTAFVGPKRDPSDPGDRRSAYRGADLLRADLYVSETTLSLYTLEGGSVAARVYRLIGATDVALHARDSSLGISAARVFGDALELHGEVARDADADALRAVVGGQYTFSNDLNVVLEIYHGTDGLTRREWDAFRGSINDDLREANARYAPLRMGRTYGFIRLSRDFGRTAAEVIAIASLRDGSSMVRTTISRDLYDRLTLQLIATEFTGSPTSEWSHVQLERIVIAGMRVHF